MKFSPDKSKYWRQQGDCLLFVRLLDVLSDDGKTAELVVEWCRNLHKGWRSIGKQKIRVRERDYNTWVTYFPRGDDLNAM